MHRDRLGLVFREKGNQSPIRDQVLDLVGERTDNTHSAFGGLNRRTCAVQRKATRHAHRADAARGSAFPIRPKLLSTSFIQADAPMVSQIGRTGRQRAIGEIGRGRAGQSAHLAYADGTHRRIRQISKANGDVHAFPDKIDQTIQEKHAGLHARMRRQKTFDHGHHFHAAIQFRRRDHQAAADVYVSRPGLKTCKLFQYQPV